MEDWTPFRQIGGVVIDPSGARGTFWENNRYQVIQRDHREGPFGAYVHLTIRSTDGAPRHDWRHLQRIKNELVGPEAEGVELYPAESRVVDTANHYHLWVFRSYRLPLGMTEGERREAEPGVTQRPFAPNPEPVVVEAEA